MADDQADTDSERAAIRALGPYFRARSFFEIASLFETPSFFEVTDAAPPAATAAPEPAAPLA